ncbi:hypothetical protein [Tepidibacter formicigenes]|uniref:Uncharacterized protein n=1 Tax=Tepidibacter formicigenes DSM 15518 TaxID=1123349 RepID=A0A1M6QK20_9FIRM|nr:hypothetical protein [Tepidibacter formicigenes]SHK20470.1 hypothetical protein SAMN02744037_01871 [Tepidibacter formicigenes DSM 15518]
MYLHNGEKFEVLREYYNLPKDMELKEKHILSKNIEVDSIIEYVYDSISQFIKGKFYIGSESLKEYMKFLYIRVLMYKKQLKRK